VLADDRKRVDYAKVHSRNSIGIQIVLLDGDRCGDGQPELSSLGEQGDCPDLILRIGK
jgi:hypothetical protein